MEQDKHTLVLCNWFLPLSSALANILDMRNNSVSNHDILPSFVQSLLSISVYQCKYCFIPYNSIYDLSAHLKFNRVNFELIFPTC